MPDYLPALRHRPQEAAPDYQRFEARPSSGALGVEIHRVDLSRRLDDTTLEELQAALLNHLVLFFRDQSLEPADLSRIGRAFGELHVNPFAEGLPEAPEVMMVRSEENEQLRFAGKWHTDISWEERPAMGSILYAVDTPGFGGDTLFSNMYLAYDTLSETMRGVLGRLRARHAASRNHASSARFGDPVEDQVVHPVVRTHPDTGCRALYVNEYFTYLIEGMTEDESAPLLEFLFAHVNRPDFCCRFQWRPGSLAFWDNRCTQHYATNDYPGESRLMHRITIVGDRPV